VRHGRLAIVLIGLAGLGLWHLTGGNADLMATCPPEERINTPEQALAFAKQLIAPQASSREGFNFANPEDYVSAIERDPSCCSVRYGDRIAEGGVAGRGWSVTLSAKHLATQYEHVVEFNSCRKVSYNGGVSLR